ncbi:hypothetical protein Tco_1310518 [Tanacetum coccineum]
MADQSERWPTVYKLPSEGYEEAISMSSLWLLGLTPTRYFLQFFEIHIKIALDSAARWQFLGAKCLRRFLAIIESKSKVRLLPEVRASDPRIEYGCSSF